jgi:hypothetical protein
MSTRHLSSNPSVELQPWDANDEPCVLCDAEHSPYGGIETTAGYLCYACARWVRRVGLTLPDFDSGKHWREEIDATP